MPSPPVFEIVNTKIIFSWLVYNNNNIYCARTCPGGKYEDEDLLILVEFVNQISPLLQRHFKCQIAFKIIILHLHRRLPIQPHVLVSSDLQVPLQHVEQHGELQKNVSGRSHIKYYISPPERRWAPCPPSPWSLAACRPTAGTFLLGKAVILSVPLNLPN